jgi:hypothetical protein
MNRTAILMLSVAPLAVAESEDPSLLVRTQSAAICKAPSPATGHVTRDSSGVRIAENWGNVTPALRLVAQPRVVIGDASRNPATHEFGRIGSAVRLSNGRVVVADVQGVAISVFDSTGRFIESLGRRGQGPGEYSRLTSLLKTDGDTLAVFEPRRLTIFTGGGAYVRTIAVPDWPAGRVLPVVIARHRDGSWLSTKSATTVLARRTQVFRGARAILHMDAAGTRADSVLSLPREEVLAYIFPDGGMQTHAVPWSTSGSLAVSSLGFVEALGDRYEFRERTPSGRMLKIVRLCRPTPSMTAADLASVRRAKAELESTADLQAGIQRMLDVLPVPTLKPAFTDLRTDPAGRVWAKEYTMPGQPQTWHVFDSGGRWLGPVLVPPRHTIMEIGRDYLIALVVDTDNVESVWVYALSAGGSAPS